MAAVFSVHKWRPWPAQSFITPRSSPLFFLFLLPGPPTSRIVLYIRFEFYLTLLVSFKSFKSFGNMININCKMTEPLRIWVWPRGWLTPAPGTALKDPETFAWVPFPLSHQGSLLLVSFLSLVFPSCVLCHPPSSHLGLSLL